MPAKGREGDTAVETAPATEQFVYCKGCGTQLESRARLSKPRVVVSSMMCEPCTEKHGHALMPAPGEPTYCYRCGTLEEVFVTPGISPATYHICPKCLPDRYARYQAGDFETPPKVAPEDENTEKAAPAKKA